MLSLFERRVALLLSLLVALFVVQPLLLSLMMGGVFAFVLFPPFRFLVVKRKWGKISAALALCLGVSIGVLIPLGGLVVVAVRAAVLQIHRVRDLPADFWATRTQRLEERYSGLLEKFTGILPVNLQEVQQAITDLAGSIGVRLAEIAGATLAALPSSLLAMAITMLSAFFFLIDSERLTRAVKSMHLLPDSLQDRIFQLVGDISRSVVLASVVSGAVQSLLMLVFGVACGIHQPVLVAVLIFVASFVPVVGSLPITLTLCISQFVMGNTSAGIGMAVGVLVIGASDNFVRPVFLKGAADMHPLLAFVSAFGGLQVFGVVGVFLGPILAGLAIGTYGIVSREALQSK